MCGLTSKMERRERCIATTVPAALEALCDHFKAVHSGLTDLPNTVTFHLKSWGYLCVERHLKWKESEGGVLLI